MTKKESYSHYRTAAFRCSSVVAFSPSFFFNHTHENKKVLLRERKRYTARRVASTLCAALSNPDLVGGGVPHPRSRGGYPVPGLGGAPRPRLGGGGLPHPRSGGGTPSRPGQGGPPLPRPGMGYPPTVT